MRRYERYKPSLNCFLDAVPSHWEEKPIKAYCRIKCIQNVSSEELLSVFLNYGVVRYCETDQQQVHKPSEDLSQYQLVEPGDLVLNNQQAWRGSVGISKYRGIVSPAYFVLSVDSSLNSQFVNYMVRYGACVPQFVIASKGVGSIQRILNPGKLLNSIFSIPPRPEQDQIVRYLDWQVSRIDKLIEGKKREIELLKELKKKILNQAVTKGLKTEVQRKKTDVVWLPDIPERWSVVRGKSILVKMERPVEATDEVVTVFRDGQVCRRSKRREEGFTFSILEIGYQGIEKGDLAVHGMDGFAGAIGISEDRGKCSPVINVLTLRNPQISNVHYVCYYLRMLAFNNTFLALSTGIRERSCDLRWKKIANLEFILPPIEEQVEIVNYINENDKRIDTQIKKIVWEINLLAEIKVRIVSDAVTGKMDVRSVKIER